MAWTTTMTTASDVDDSLVTLWEQGVILAATPELVIDQLTTVNRQLGAKTIQFTKYSNLAIPSALTENEDPASVALADAAITLTPVEEGNVVTTTSLSDFQTGGKVNTAAALLVGRNMGATQDKRGVEALEAFSTTVIYPNSATAASNVGTSDVLDYTFASRLYNKLARINVPSINGNYIAIAHDDCLYDLRKDLIPIKQYADLTSVLQGEVGMAAGIRFLRSSNVTVTANSNGTIDTYKVCVVGFNGLGKAISSDPHPTISRTDKLLRFLNVGWTGCFKYGVIDTANVVQGICASSVGNN